MRGFSRLMGACAVAFVAGTAQATVLDFEGYATGGLVVNHSAGSPYTEEGYSLSSGGTSGLFNVLDFPFLGGTAMVGNTVTGWSLPRILFLI